VGAIISGGTALAVYVYTLAPTVVAGDSAELVAAAHVLGIAHPTGYPLYLLLAKLFDLIPLASAPVRIACLSALCGAGAAGAVAWAAATITGSAAAGVLAGLAAGLNGALWSQATQPEVYALNALIVALAMAMFAGRREGGPQASVVWLGLLTGLALAHHRTAVLFVGPLLVGAILAGRPPARGIGKAGLAAAAPLAFYLYLPIRAAARPRVMWSEFDGWRDVAAHISGANYYSLYAFQRPASEMVEVAWEAAQGATSELTVGGIALCAIGLGWTLRARRDLASCLLVGVALLSIWNLGYRVRDWEVFFIPCALAAALWAGAGLFAAAEWLHRHVGARARWCAPVLTAAALVAIPTALLQSNWAESGHRGDWRAYDKVRAAFAQVAPDGVYVSNRDNFLAMYLQFVEGRRRDIDVVSPQTLYAPCIEDARIRRALPGLAREHVLPIPYTDPEGLTRGALRLSVALAEELSWERPVYCGADPATPPRGLPVRALWSDLYEVRREPAPPPAEVEIGEPAVEYPEGLALVSATVEPPEVAPGEPVRVTFHWRVARVLEEPRFLAVRLAPAGEVGAGPKGELRDWGGWLGYGRPLSRTQDSLAHRQQFAAAVPTPARPGRWEVRVGVASDRAGQIRLMRVAELRVREPMERPGERR
jgi:hypothetical protein